MLKRLVSLVFVACLLALVCAERAAALPDLTLKILPTTLMLPRISWSFQMDPRGVFAASYYRTDRKLYYFNFGQQNWAEELVPGPLASLGDNSYTALVFIYGEPHIMFYDSMNQMLKHAWRAQGSWSIETVDNSGDVGRSVAAMDCGAGKICAVYHDFTNKTVKFARGRSGDWTTEVVDACQNARNNLFAAIALTNERKIILSYYDENQMLPKVAEESDEGWTIETLPAIAEYGKWTSIAASNDGTLHFSAGSSYDYPDGGDDGYLFYGTRDLDRVWRVDALTSFIQTIGACSSVSLLQSGLPQISARNRKQPNGVTQGKWQIYYTYQDIPGHWLSMDLFAYDEIAYDYDFLKTSTFVSGFGDPVVAYEFNIPAPASANIALHGPADSDGDMLPDERDPMPNSPDTDADGIADGIEVLQHATNPGQADSDSDGINDAADIDPRDPNAAQLVPDGSCEAVTPWRWSPIGNPQGFWKERGVIAQGTRSLCMTSGGGYSGVIQRNLASSPATGYWLQLYYRRGQGSLRASVGWGGDFDFEADPLLDNASSGWTSYERFFTTPPDGGDLRLAIETDGEACVDALEIYEAQPASTPSPMPTIVPSPTPTPTATHTPTATATAISTVTPTMTMTASPSATSAVQPSPTPTPTPTASPTVTNPGAVQVAAKLRLKGVKAAIKALIRSGSQALAGVSIELFCGGKRIGQRTSDASGSASFAVKRKAKARSCYLSAAGAVSKKVKVRAFTPLF